MTTVAWDGHTLASDSMSAWSYNLYKVPKIYRVRDDLIAFAGNIQDGLKFLEWYKSGCRKKGKPDISEEAFCGLVIRNKKCYWVESYLIMSEVVQGKYAMGSGASFAMAAMHCGKTAVEAVEVAIHFDSGSGGEVMSFVAP